MSRCIACDCELMEPGGYAGTGMCGPCCTGEADSLNEDVPKPRRRRRRKTREEAPDGQDA